MKKIFILISILFLVSSCSYIFRENIPDWEGWKDVVIPTESMVKAEIKIPSDWNFVVENETVSLVNKNSDKVIAEQLCQAFATIETNDEKKSYFDFHDGIYNKSVFNIREEILTFDKRVYSGYDPSDVYDFRIDGKCIFGFAIYYLYYFADDEDSIDKKHVNFYLFMILNDDSEYETLLKSFYSYEFGGDVYI